MYGLLRGDEKMKFYLKGDTEGVKKIYDGIRESLDKKHIGKYLVFTKLTQEGEDSIIELYARPKLLFDGNEYAKMQLQLQLMGAITRSKTLATIEKME